MYQLGIGLVDPVLYGRIILLSHRLGQSSHEGHAEVSYVSDFETCEGILQYSQAWRHQHILCHDSNLKLGHSIFSPQSIDII